MFKIFGGILLSIILSSNIFAKNIPKLTEPVIDQSGALSTEFKNNLNEKLKEEFKKSGRQIQILLVDSLDGEPIENYSIKLFDEWQLGNKKDDKGVLVLISIGDHKSRIEVGRGLEGSITDLVSNRILQNGNVFFKNKDFEGGISSIVNEIIEKSVDTIPTGTRPITKTENVNYIGIILFILGALLLISTVMYFLGYDGFILVRLILEILIAIIGSGRGGGGWSGQGGGSAGGGSSRDWD